MMMTLKSIKRLKRGQRWRTFKQTNNDQKTQEEEERRRL